MTKTNSQMKEKKKDETEQIDNFIFIGYQMEFILVISLFIPTKQQQQQKLKLNQQQQAKTQEKETEIHNEDGRAHVHE